MRPFLFFSQNFLGRFDFVREGMLRQFRERFDLPIEHWAQTVGYVLLMRPMDRDTFLAVAVIAARLLAQRSFSRYSSRNIAANSS